ncbi:MAG: zinc-dependent metalloprotease, partial [Actinomycetota bacterium]|nr:zinc-dependent metalloprotease [Actinomycetota bacterium]
AHVVAYTGLRPRGALPAPEAVARPEWIAANVVSLASVLDPLADRLGAGLGPLRGAAQAAGGALISAEAGALTGYLSQRVLGQYDLVLLDPHAPARLLFVAPNIVEAGGRLQVDRSDLLTWIAFHEVTHAVQFEAVPWLRAHVSGLLRELLDSLEVTLDAGTLLRLPSGQDLRGLVEAVREQGILSAVAGPERKEILDRVQVVMAVIEGHAEHVMDVVGDKALRTLPQLRGALDRRRRERPPLLRMLERLIGLETKLRQYEDGKRFCDTIVSLAGPAALHRVFDAPERLPSAAELGDPGSWLARTRVPVVPR